MLLLKTSVPSTVLRVLSVVILALGVGSAVGLGTSVGDGWTVLVPFGIGVVGAAVGLTFIAAGVDDRRAALKDLRGEALFYARKAADAEAALRRAASDPRFDLESELNRVADLLNDAIRYERILRTEGEYEVADEVGAVLPGIASQQ